MSDRSSARCARVPERVKKKIGFQTKRYWLKISSRTENLVSPQCFLSATVGYSQVSIDYFKLVIDVYNTRMQCRLISLIEKIDHGLVNHDVIFIFEDRRPSRSVLILSLLRQPIQRAFDILASDRV